MGSKLADSFCMPVEFEFVATPDLGAKATRYLLRRRGGRFGPFILVLLPVLIGILAADETMRPAAYLFGGAVLMLLLLFCLAVAQRRRISRRFFKSTANHTVRVSLDDAGITVQSAAGTSSLPWSSNTRVWAGEEVVLVFYQGWHYFAVPAAAMPAAALEFITAKASAKK